jgi:hypothetical protein
MWRANALAFVLGAILLWVIGLFVILYLPMPFPADIEHRYHLGGAFEAFHALFDALAMSFLLLTVLQQQQELRQQRQEIRHLEEASRLQTFQTAFFNYLGVFNAFINNLQEGGGNRARDCIASWRWDSLENPYKAQGQEATSDLVGELFRKMPPTRAGLVTTYFQHLENLLQFVAAECTFWQARRQAPGSTTQPADAARPSPTLGFDSDFYRGMIRGQLSFDEIELIRFRTRTPGGENLARLVLELDLFSLDSASRKFRTEPPPQIQPFAADSPQGPSGPLAP